MRVSNVRLGIGIPLDFHMVPSDFFLTYASMEKPPHVLIPSPRASIEEMRNAIVDRAQEENLTHLLMCDTDQAYPTDTITRLLAHRRPVVGAKIRRRYPPFDVLMFRGTTGQYQNVTGWTPGELVEVDATGTGCVLYEMSVFRTIPAPWFETYLHDGKPVGEDFAFCAKLRKAGIPIAVDTAVDVHHLSQLRITDSFAAVYSKIAKEQSVTA